MPVELKEIQVLIHALFLSKRHCKLNEFSG